MRKKHCSPTTANSPSRTGIRARAVACVFVLYLTVSGPTDAFAKSVTKFYKRVLGIPVAGVVVNLSDPGVKVSVSLARGFPRAKEPFPSIVERSDCAAAITGTYFGLQSGIPIGTIVVDGKTWHNGRRGTALALDYKNQATFSQVRRNARQVWEDFETVLACGPMLVRNGRVELSPWHEGFSDRGLFGRATRCAVGLRKDRRLLLATVRSKITLYELGKIMRALGCRDAMNLDGGTSSALYYRGRVLVSPGRKLVNVLTVHQDVSLASRFLPIKVVAERRKEFAHQCFERGKWFESEGDFRRAASEFGEADRMDPRIDYALLYLIAMERSGSDSEIAAANARVAERLMDAGQMEEAIAHLKTALQFDGSMLSARKTLADAYRKLGFLSEAAREDELIRMIELKNGSSETASSFINRSNAQFTASETHPREEQRRLPPFRRDVPMMIGAGLSRKQSEPESNEENDR